MEPQDVHPTIGQDYPFPCSGSPPAGDARLAWPGLSHLHQVMDEGVLLVWELGGFSLESCSGMLHGGFFWQAQLMPPLLSTPSWRLQGLRDQFMGTDHLLSGPAFPKGCGFFLICPASALALSLLMVLVLLLGLDSHLAWCCPIPAGIHTWHWQGAGSGDTCGATGGSLGLVWDLS